MPNPLCSCGRTLLQDQNSGDLVCLRCERIIPGILTERKLPIDPGPQHRPVRKRPEEDVQTQIIRALQMHGYKVLSTVHRRTRQRCPKCGEWGWPQGGTGTSPGVPDLLVCVPGGLVGLEVKGPRTPLSPEQRELALAGHITVVRTAEEAVTCVEGSVHGRVI